MNTKVVLLLMVSVISLIMCGCDNKSTYSILENAEMRKQLYSGILSNHEYLKEFMDSMRTSDHARMMIRHDSSMNRGIMKDLETKVIIDHLMARTEKDSTACKLVCRSMMDHKKTTASMLETLSDKGVVKKGCMMDKEAKKAREPEKHKHH